MKIRFTSIQDHKTKGVEPKIISFEADAEYDYFIDDEDLNKFEYHTYHFKEPSVGESNRIEINEKRVNIFTGMSTLTMLKGIKAANSFVNVDGSQFFLKPLLHNVVIEDKIKKFKYELFGPNDELIGEFNVSLEEI
ncbi:hypothetical protein NPA07_02250 [Mycoplasmopsis caviae]|uniref:DUF1934 domain-containing protein n=1 Tax=Mycoplasmopsis caviae TaxID=55603 RepID=A0A3P8LHP1_9BACT|nr:hypothetical protein [Mycoplasmopsis caviae]UUD35672.1 hypothetical protein NPA07_02250 [Mycoplasmopsis caviae]VDR41582.1 Uncharacterised protein [Mycoplasmopsis caviae]